jgi:hypothetical protein
VEAGQDLRWATCLMHCRSRRKTWGRQSLNKGGLIGWRVGTVNGNGLQDQWVPHGRHRGRDCGIVSLRMRRIWD